MDKLKFGCIADDFTGASDAASFIKKAGLNTVLINNLPPKDFQLPDDTEAVVIALKIRTAPVVEAVDCALKAAEWLNFNGAEHLYYKYCSTFDSTDKGNIGPVIDAIIDKYGIQETILCPGLPVNGRTVKNGHLYVNGVPLNETHMRFHPLTPMKSSFLPKLMEKQGKYSCVLIRRDELNQENFEPVKRQQPIYYVPDYVDEQDGENIARLFHSLRFLTGGSGILTYLCRYYQQGGSYRSRTLLLAGSCSEATLNQIRRFQDRGGFSIQINPQTLFDEEGATQIENVYKSIWNRIITCQQDAVLIYSSANKEKVRETQEKYGKERVSAYLEQLMAELATNVVKMGWEKVVVAGGETSGAVTEALHVNAFSIGRSIAPGVPILKPIDQSKLRLVLKSGNFGDEDFFLKAIQLLQEE